MLLQLINSIVITYYYHVFVGTIVNATAIGVFDCAVIMIIIRVMLATMINYAYCYCYGCSHIVFDILTVIVICIIISVNSTAISTITLTANLVPLVRMMIGFVDTKINSLAFLRVRI